MKRRKIMVSLKWIFGAVLLPVCLSAQTPRGDGPRGEGRRFTAEEMAKRTTEWMTEELKLTAEQTAPVDSVNLLFAQAQQVLFQSAEGDREKLRESVTALNREKEKALSAVLTEEQLALYRKKIGEQAANRRRQRP
ncbi:MAG: DUF4890 domain-containing protein [Tannerella sp.]|jgi:hypothetical protein|nr:DUF4890 domain-containing protein [Tannerella sp.]